MASFSVDDFTGNGALKELLPTLLEQGWEDVPTLKIMNSEDMAAINMTQQQKDAWEIRSYLHDRALMQYGDRLEASGKCLPELLNLSSGDLASQFGMKRGHIARFMDRTTACAAPYPKPIPSRKGSKIGSMNYVKMQSVPRSPAASFEVSNKSYDQSTYEPRSDQSYAYKGIVASEPAEARLCGCIQPPSVVDTVAPYSAIENISVQKLTPEYKIGMERLVKTKTPPMKASELWRDMPAILLCIRRPGCIMCRAEAHQLYAKKPLFDAMGVQLIAVLHQHIEAEVKDFWPRYWGGVVIYDQRMEFFRALGGGELLKDKFISGFVLNPRAIANYRRAKAMGLDQNFKGEGEIKGGLFVVGAGRSGIAYQFIERNFGDWAPHAEVYEICSQLLAQNQQQDQGEYTKSSMDY